MAQINITLSNEEVLEVITGDRDKALKFLLERILNELMAAESEEQLGAGMHERSESRKDYRNGTRERELTTRIGKLTLQVPRHRNEPFHTMVFENYSRSEASLIATMVQMVIAGVSTRKVQKVVETLCGTSFSKSTVSKLCEKLDAEISVYKNRSLAEYDTPFLMVDATYFKARENGHIESKAFLVALGINSSGKREILDFAVHDAEDNYSWKSFFSGLRARGLNTVRLVSSDAHKSIRKAIMEVYPNAAWQRCQVHMTRNILDNTPNRYKEGLALELRKLFNAQTIAEARRYKDELIDDYIDVAPEAMNVLDNGFEDAMTVMVLPEYIRKNLRSTNLIERLNEELKRRSNVIQIFPNAASVLRLMGAVAIEYNSTIQAKQKLFSEERMNTIRETLYLEFSKIAEKQKSLLAA